MDIASYPLGKELQGFLDTTSAFNENIDRAFRLVRYATKSNFDGSTPNEIKTFIEDILRSCVVLAHASLETALRDIFTRRLKEKAKTEVPRVPLVGLQRNEKFNWENLYHHRQKTVEQIIDESIDDYISRISFNSTTDIASCCCESTKSTAEARRCKNTSVKPLRSLHLCGSLLRFATTTSPADDGQ